MATWNKEQAALKAYTDAKKKYDDAVAADTACKAMNKNRATQQTECDKLGGKAGFAKAADGKTQDSAKNETEKTKYVCDTTKAHAWTASTATADVDAMTAITHTEAEAATLTGVTWAVCKPLADAADKAACTAKKEADAALTSCCDAAAGTEDKTAEWSATGGTWNREVDATTKEEKWTLASVTAT